MAIQRVELKFGDGIDSPDLMDEVEILQIRLKNWGLLRAEGQIDGQFGNDTKAAVERFQSLRPADPTRSPFVPGGLKVTGAVDRDTWAELEKVSPDQIEIIPRQGSSDGSMPADFPSADDIISIAKVPSSIHAKARSNIPVILNECVSSNVTDRGQIAYILATAERESLLGTLMVELASGKAYNPPSQLANDLGNTEAGDGPLFKGRGFVQITGRRNYTYWTKKLRNQGINVDLVANPEKATIREIAAKICVQGMRDGDFTGTRLSQFIAGNTRDFFNARKIVNPGELTFPKGREIVAEIEEHAKFYLKALLS